MTTKHTPGPWHVGTNGDNCARDHAICDGPMVIAKVYGTGYPFGRGASPQSTANARLIAAAPELYAALKELQKQLREHIKLDVRKHYSLMVVDAAATTALAKVQS